MDGQNHRATSKRRHTTRTTTATGAAAGDDDGMGSGNNDATRSQTHEQPVLVANWSPCARARQRARTERAGAQ
eukprot:6868036-Lingulodinium_polyedra.AAC.1